MYALDHDENFNNHNHDGGGSDALHSEQLAILRDKALLHVALGCVYLQSGDDLVIGMGQPYLNYDGYETVLSEEEVYGCVLPGGIVPRRARKWPVREDYDEGEARFQVAMHEAACVHTYWLYAHIYLQNPEGAGAPRLAPDALELIERAAETMGLVADRIRGAALTLADRMGVKDYLMQSDAVAEASLVAEHPWQPSVVRLPLEFKQLLAWRTHARNSRTPPSSLSLKEEADECPHDKEEDEARAVLETVVTDVFGYGVCKAEDAWQEIEEVMVCTTRLRKRFSEMTLAERVSSGTVVLGHIQYLLQSDTPSDVEKALSEALVAARALEHNARALVEACRAYLDRNSDSSSQ